MFGLFKKKEKILQPPQLMDIDGDLIMEGDEVISQRYELGNCKVILIGLEFFYESQETKKQVSYVRMIDAITGFQKVKKN